MKKPIFFLLFFCFFYISGFSQGTGGCGEIKVIQDKVPISFGIVIYSNDAETVWNAFRLANFSLEQGDTVSVFLLGKGVEINSISNKDFDVAGQAGTFTEKGGKIFACGTCMNSRKIESSSLCPKSNLSELYGMTRRCTKLLTF